MSDIYDLHSKAFARVSAYVVLHNGERVATIAFKFPADGAGRLYAYVHWLGVPMVRGFAGGYGYDKRSAAVADAVRKIPDDIAGKDGARQAFIEALERDSGSYWDRRLEAAGFTVLQAV
jgi:hypothetical protein